MKKICLLFILALFACIEGMAAKSDATWYFLAPTSTSVSNDSNISVTYRIDNNFGNAPYPDLCITIENKNDKIIYIDLGTSYLKRNDIASPIYSPTTTSHTIGSSSGVGVNVGFVIVGGGNSSSVTTTNYAQRIISIPPHSKSSLDEILLFPQGSEDHFGNLFYYTYIGNQKTPSCVSSVRMKSKEVFTFSEENTVFNIGVRFNYSFSEDCKETHNLETTYYVERVIGSKRPFAFFNLWKEYKIIDKVYPEWRSLVDTNQRL